jgi:hypothetical protein
MKLTTEEKTYLEKQTQDYYEALRSGAMIVYTHKHRSASNMSYRYDLHLYQSDDSGKVNRWYLNFWLANTYGLSRDTKTGEIKEQGLGTDRSFLAQTHIDYVFQMAGLPKLDWRIEASY